MMLNSDGEELQGFNEQFYKVVVWRRRNEGGLDEATLECGHVVVAASPVSPSVSSIFCAQCKVNYLASEHDEKAARSD